MNTQTNQPTQKAFDVMLDGVRINTVFEPKFRSEESVRRHLVERMMYDPAIVVVDVERQFQKPASKSRSA